ncbi:hypothetical protein, partial [Escherichia coli]
MKTGAEAIRALATQLP